MTGPEQAERSPETVVRCDQLLKIYSLGGQEIIALQGLQLSIGRAERVGVIGASGSGKSTLLNILGALDRPTAGTVVVDGTDLMTADGRARNRYRQRSVGFVWQQSSRNLIHYLSAIDNVALPMRTQRGRDARRRREELLRLVDLADRFDHRPVELSGGEQQRVAIAVALANEPALLLADEPTGELDGATAAGIYRLLERVTDETGLTQIVVSHDPELAHNVHRVVTVRDGRVAAEHRLAATSDADDYEEFLTVDRFGQVQLPESHREVLGEDGLIEAVIENDEIRLKPATRRPSSP